MTREEAIGWLELLSKSAIGWNDHSEENARIRGEAERRVAKALNFAIEALKKAQGPRLMTWDEVKEWGDTEEVRREPIFVENRYEKTFGSSRWAIDWLDLLYNGGTMEDEKQMYKKFKRCWTSRPTIEQMRETPWP